MSSCKIKKWMFENIKIGTFQFIMKWFERNAHLYKPSDVGKNKFYVLKISSNNTIDDVLLWFYHLNNVFFTNSSICQKFGEHFVKFVAVFPNIWTWIKFWNHFYTSCCRKIEYIWIWTLKSQRIKCEHPITCQLMIITWWKSASAV